ncbi:GspH/FimT family pseudopilin [sulfur-oxidizing endosymbiont of Gigantopelta aegis]|uniref:GspH/FimT family pseudopilin n=1 Tax=sulfur-oxidizing endosymbiont of Gigantopelta aegis TaxID=2794934 RepID=UPI0024841410|nr:GspH/FimT family pseudopilin [sulfur-oxidizing endosymbiont of Gigantopelta aegis]
MNIKSHKNINGFTLIELMITIAIAAILLSLALPSFDRTLRTNRTTTQANSVHTALNIARSEAIKRSSAVTVCASNDQTSPRSCSGANDWSVGWIIFQDLNANGTFDDDADVNLCEVSNNEASEDCLLRSYKALNGALSLTGSATRIIYTARGLPQSTLTLTLNATGCGAGEQRAITVSPTGRANVSSSNC